MQLQRLLSDCEQTQQRHLLLVSRGVAGEFQDLRGQVLCASVDTRKVAMMGTRLQHSREVDGSSFSCALTRPVNISHPSLSLFLRVMRRASYSVCCVVRTHRWRMAFLKRDGGN
jgi:hypothetical protein